MKLVAKPGREVARMQTVQPKRNRPQLHSNRIEIDPETIAVGDVSPYPLLLDHDLVLRDRSSCLFLLPLEVEICELVRGLHQEGSRPHCRFEDLEVQQLIGGQITTALHQRVFDQQPCEGLRRVVRR